jgi:hypothetical protein
MCETANALSPEDWYAVLDAMRYAAEEMDYDLHDTRNSDFYAPDERQLREREVANWRRLAGLIVPFTREPTNAND